MATTPFSRTVRSLHQDSFARSQAVLLIVGLILLAWLLWFFAARLTLYEVSDEATLVEPTRLVATFSAAGLLRIEPGQPAEFRLDDFPWTTYGSMPATVTTVDYRDGQTIVDLLVLPQANPRIPQREGLRGTLAVTVGDISPAALLLCSAADQLAPWYSGPLC